jgi:hypothetical protein
MKMLKIISFSVEKIAKTIIQDVVGKLFGFSRDKTSSL